MPMMHFDPLYILMLLPAMVLAMFATFYTRSTFGRHARTRSASGLPGAQAAGRMLASQGVHDVTIEASHGFLSDHYDPMSRTLRLSPDVYGSPSLSAVGVACHEAGHALQHADRYAPLMLRTALVPATQFGSKASYFLLVLGLIFGSLSMIKIGVLVFALVVVFALVTLPVEWDASARAKRLMVSSGVVSAGESTAAGAVLNAAFLTYVASAFTALMTLLYYLVRFGLLRSKDD